MVGAGAPVAADGETWDDGARFGLGPTSLATVAAAGAGMAWAWMAAGIGTCMGAKAEL
jgi:hypothetical protein